MTENAVSPVGGVSTVIRRATLLPLIGITYCMVAGGPYGLEELVSSAGYRTAVLLLIITPLLWSFPVTLMVSELSTALPQDGGYYVWVRRAMGPFWGFQEAWLSLASSIFDMALYPTLFVTYLARLWPAAGGAKLSILIGVGLIIVCVAINIAGIRLVGESSVVMTLAMLLPFAVMVILALCRHPQATAVATAPSTLTKTTLISGILVVMWNYMGWDNASTIAGEVDRPQRTYPMAMLISVLLVAATYIIPVAAAAHGGIAPESFAATGSWVDIGKSVGNAVSSHLGTVMKVALTVGGMISAFSMFNALILSYSRVPIAMAADGFLPKVMALRTRRTGAPWVAILVCAVGWGMCMKLGFDKLLLLDTLLYGLSLILEFAALIALRVREPRLPRPYKVPGGLPGCIVISLLPLVIMGVAAYYAFFDEDAHKGLIVTGITVIAGVILYFVTVVINPRATDDRETPTPAKT